MGREQRANEARRAEIRKIVERVTGHYADRGQIIGVGYASFIANSYSGWETMPPGQLDQLRVAFFAGAQHLFGSIMNMLHPNTEPTEQDMQRMNLIYHELNAFIAEYMQRQGITDPDIGPPREPEQ